MKPSDIALSRQIEADLQYFDQNIESLRGIRSSQNLKCLVSQIIDSIRRIRYITVIRQKGVGAIYTNPLSPFFDPIKAAVYFINNGNINEAFWLVFLATHFGKHRISGWVLARELYKGAGAGQFWDWQATSSNFPAFQQWLSLHQNRIKAVGSFGNHRKYQSIDAFSPAGTGAAIGSYISWVGSNNDHNDVVHNMQVNSGNDPKAGFDFLYRSMNAVASFGRTGRFDYLTMVGKIGLINIEPPSAYMNGATGPLIGARLLFSGNKKARLSADVLNDSLKELQTHLQLYFGMQVLEDALCNWQKSPSSYVHFTG